MTDHSELKRLADEATPGPWIKTIDGVMPKGEKFGIFGNAGAYNGRANREFIAAANPAAVLALLAEVEALRKDKQRLNFIESQNHKTLKFHKKKWSFQGFANYEYSVFGSLREAIDDAMNEVD